MGQVRLAVMLGFDGNAQPSLPYFHTGTVPTLDEAVRIMAKTQLQQDLNEEQVQAIVAFLNSLTGKLR